MLLPVIGLIQVGQQAWADRYAYLPLLGIYLAFSYSLARWLEHRPAVRQTAIPVVVAALLLLLPLSWRQARVWRNSESLYTHALAVTDNNAVAHDNLGNVYLRQGQSGKALEHYQQALRIEPRDAQTFINMGDALQLMGHTEKAIKYYQQSLRIDGNNAQTYSNLGLALNALGQLQEAAWHCREALRLKPDYAEAYNNLGVVDVSMGNLTNALKHFEMAVRLDPTYTAARENFVAVRERLNEEWF
jgi:tetratricopeptide (TPR) repeat protein